MTTPNFTPRTPRTRQELLDAPKPSNPAELEVLSRWYFGKPLHLAFLRIRRAETTEPFAAYGQYEVAELYNDYHGNGWLFGQCCIHGYDYSRDFWQHVVGVLYCGGIADHSYGQVRIKGHRDRLRLQRFEECLRRKESGRLGKAFERLAREYGAGENTETADDGVLTTGRVDGAVGASITQAAQP